MDKDPILSVVKEQMLSIIKNMTLETVTENREIVIKQLDFLSALKDLPVIECTEVIVEEPPNSVNTSVIDSGSPQFQPTEQLYTFERKLRGGLIPVLDGGYPIPEKMVRDLAAEHGDKLRIISSQEHAMGTRYWFDIADKGNCMDPEGRVQLDYCIVEIEKDIGFIVRRTQAGDIRIQGVPHTFVLKSEDVVNFQLEQGDIIDLAYHVDRPNESSKVIWKHKIENPEPLRAAVKSQRTAKNEEKCEKSPKESIVDKSVFQRKRIAIIGAYSMKTRYREEFERLDVDLTHATGDEDLERMGAIIRKADFVIISSGENGHYGVWSSVDLAKKHQIPFIVIDREGPKAVLLEAEKKLKVIDGRSYR